MTVALSRRRTGVLFFSVVLGHIILISVQVNSRRGVPVVDGLTFGAFAEVQRAASAGISGLLRAWHSYIDLRHVRGDNERLTRELADAQIELQRQRAMADRTRSLERLLGLRDSSGSLSTVAAQIIAAGATPDFLTVTLDRGTSDGVKPDMAVIAASGVVGRVVMATRRAAKVQLLIDR